MYRVLYKLLVSLWLLVAMNCGSTGGGSTKPHLPQEEVNVVNALFRRLKTPWELDRHFSANDCGVKLKNEIICNCSLEDHTICRVTQVDLSGHDLKGRIPTEIGNLSHLRILDLSKNKLHGSIPKSFGNLSQLLELYLWENHLEGPIPPFLGELKSFKVIDLSYNWFNDSIPSALGALPSLEFLILNSNVLSGPIPDELGNASNLEYLYLFNNRLSGQLPHQLGNLKNMQIMYLGNNEFTGELPPSFKELKKLVGFGIEGHNFRGPIPKYIASWEHLEVLELIGNNFEGPLPTAIASLINLTYLDVDGLTASPKGGKDFTLPNVRTMTSLKSLTLRNCSLTGPIPDFIWRLPLLSYLDLSFNNLTGGIPNIVNQQVWKAIFLKGNNLTGSLPGWLTSLSDSYVDVSENFFTNAAITHGNISKKLNLFLCCSNKTTMPAKWQEWQEVHHNCNKTLSIHIQFLFGLLLFLSIFVYGS